MVDTVVMQAVNWVLHLLQGRGGWWEYLAVLVALNSIPRADRRRLVEWVKNLGTTIKTGWDAVVKAWTLAINDGVITKEEAKSLVDEVLAFVGSLLYNAIDALWVLAPAVFTLRDVYRKKRVERGT